MRKLSSFLVFCLVLGGAFPVTQCLARTTGAITLGFDGNQDPDDDEFLYDNETQFNLTKKGYENSGYQTSGDGKGYECDGVNSNAYKGGDRLKLGKNHVFKGQIVPYAATYSCVTNLDDYWSLVAKDVCTTQWGDLAVGQMLKNPKTATDCSGMEKSDSNGVKFNVVCKEGPKVYCKAIDCGPNYDVKDGKCVEKKTGTGLCANMKEGESKVVICSLMKSPNPDGASVCGVKVINGQCVPMLGRCKDGYISKDPMDPSSKYNFKGYECGGPDYICKGFKRCEKKDGGSQPVDPIAECQKTRDSQEGKACCTLNKKIAEWRDPHCVCMDGNGNVDPNKEFEILPGLKGNCKVKEMKNCRDTRQTDVGKACCDVEEAKVGSYTVGTNECVCNDDNMEFRIVNGKGQCVSKPVDGDDDNGNGGTTTVVAPCDQKIELERLLANQNLTQEQRGLVTTAYNLCINGDNNNVIINNAVNITIINPEDVARAVKDMKKDLASIESGFKASVWKTAEGNFNGARLASDSIAGVVLGTAGGLITSSVIKKNQVKSGFEHVQCTVGGQAVAGWGDQFNVGMR